MLPDILSSIVTIVCSCIQSGTLLAFSAPVNRFGRALLLEAGNCADLGVKLVSKLAVRRHPWHRKVVVDFLYFDVKRITLLSSSQVR